MGFFDFFFGSGLKDSDFAEDLNGSDDDLVPIEPGSFEDEQFLSGLSDHQREQLEAYEADDD